MSLHLIHPLKNKVFRFNIIFETETFNLFQFRFVKTKNKDYILINLLQIVLIIFVIQLLMVLEKCWNMKLEICSNSIF